MKNETLTDNQSQPPLSIWQNRKYRARKICLNCKLSFGLKPGRVATAIYCSRKCFNERYIAPKKSVEDRFLEKIVKAEGCWLWNACKSNHGYGHMRIKGKMIKAHRLSYMLWKGSIPEGMQVCHKCDIPACVRPDHLFLGTAKDNTQDSIRKRRNPYRMTGEDNPVSKLTYKLVEEMRSSYKNGVTIVKIAKGLGISYQYCNRIIRNKRWKI